MCCDIAYVMAAATGTRREEDRPAEWKREDEECEEEAAVAAA